MATDDTRAKDIAFVFIGCSTIVLNVTEIILISRKTNQKTYEKLLLSLAIADGSVGIAIAAFKIGSLVYAANPFQWNYQERFGHVVLFSINCSIWNLLMIAIDRFLAVKFPIRHRIIVTSRRTNMAILGVWITTLSITTCHIFTAQSGKVDSDHFTLASAYTILIFGGLLIAIYIDILHLISKSTERTTGDQKDNQTRWQKISSLLHGKNKHERSAFITSCTVAVTFVICTYPFAIEYSAKRLGEDVSFAAKLTVVLNSLVNPVIYFFKGLLMSR